MVVGVHPQVMLYLEALDFHVVVAFSLDILTLTVTHEAVDDAFHQTRRMCGSERKILAEIQ